MAYTKIDSKKEIEWGKGVMEDILKPITGRDGSYFHFVDLEIIRNKHPDATGFQVKKGKVDNKHCAILVLVKGKGETGATYFFDHDEEYIALSCPYIIDTEGAKEYGSGVSGEKELRKEENDEIISQLQGDGKL